MEMNILLRCHQIEEAVNQGMHPKLWQMPKKSCKDYMAQLHN